MWWSGAGRARVVAATLGRVVLVTALSGAPACLSAPASVEVDLIRDPVTLSHAAQLFSAGEPLPAEGEFVGVCVYPGRGHQVSGRWTVLTPSGREARVVARAELVNGKVVTLGSPSSAGNSLCVLPRRGGPLEAPVRRIGVMASTPILVERIVWQTGDR